jgi:chemotaxis protein methyltransferase CheR
VTTPEPSADQRGDADFELRLLLDAIFHKYHYDFRNYAGASLKRRVQVALTRFDCETISQLQDRVLHDATVFTDLLSYLTVQVSDMFRDPEYFRALREKVVPYLSTYPSIKLWVAGCATGEEAYSLAIVLAEEGLLSRSLIYATDINPDCLRSAEEGIYELDRFARFSANYLAAGGRRSLSDYYTTSATSALLDRGLKKAILFCDHSLATDNAFAEVELISCRNVLIYFERELQDRAVGVLREALCRKGFLGLGMKETLRFSPHAPAFTDLLPEERIYQKL